jgi:hypothetical protein
MQLSRCLGLSVVDGADHRVGTVIDVRLTIGGNLVENPFTPRVFGLVVSPRTQSSYLGYERTTATTPALLARLLRWRHRGTFLAAWEDVRRIDTDRVTLRAGYTKFSAMLPAGG